MSMTSPSTSSHYHCHVFEDAAWHCQQHENKKQLSPPPPVEFSFEFRLGNKVRFLCESEEGDAINILETQGATSTVVFLVDRRRLISDTTARWVLSSLLSLVKVPLQFQDDMIQRISSLALVMANAASNRGRKTLRMVVSIEFIKVVKLNLEEATLLAATESMNDGEFRAVPATKSSIEALEKVRIEDSGTGSILSCMICLEELPFGSEATCMPCSHVYHGGCIVQWLERSNLCPLCRFQMPC